jgi:hypothetical protein
VILPAGFIGLTCFRPGGATAAAARPGGRPESSTYLTLPEWYIVYSTEEHAAFIAAHPPSHFPHLRAVRQYWIYYAGVCRATRGRYPFDAGVHLMLGVIGVSFSAENALKGVYEATVGRATELVAGFESDEDRFAAATARQYGGFMHTVPWYRFPFGARLRALWRETGWWGPQPVRKWERKLALTAEYGVKAVYAALIRLSTGAVYGADDLHVEARVEAAPEALRADARVRPVQQIAPGAWIVRLPRYEPFTGVAAALVARGVRFVEIAGNDEILLTALVPRGWRHSADAGRLVLVEPVLTDPATARLAVAVSVPALHAVLPLLAAQGARLEHLYDY